MNRIHIFGIIVFLAATFCSCSKRGEETFTAPALPQIPANEVSLSDFGAVADGQTLCTEAFSAALTALDSLGGGTLHIPAGTWLMGPILMHSHICLDLQEGAVVRVASDMNLFAVRDSLFHNGDSRFLSPITAYQCTDIAITGSGTFDGSGDYWRPVRKEYATEDEWAALVADTIHGILNSDSTRWSPISVEERPFCQSRPLEHNGVMVPWQEFKNRTRPENLWLYECERVLLEGVTFRNSPGWNVHPELCRELTVRNCNIQNLPSAANGDGLDMESCSHVLVQHCMFDVGDDAICLKSGANAEGRRRGRPTEDVLVEDCTVRHAHGGFVVGSEMSGGVRNVHLHNCTFEGTDSGLRFKTNRDRGGLVENILVEDVTMKDIKADALLFDMYYHGQSPVLEENEGHSISDTAVVAVNECTPCFRGIHFRNITCTGVGRTFYFDGLHESPVQDISIEHLSSQASAPSLFSECSGIVLKDITLSGEGNSVINLYHATNITAPDEVKKSFHNLE